MSEFVVSLGNDDSSILIIRRGFIDGKPLKHLFQNNYLQCNDAVHAWMLENNIKYTIDCDSVGNHDGRDMEFYIIFSNRDDALLFKLTWGGK